MFYLQWLTLRVIVLLLKRRMSLVASSLDKLLLQVKYHQLKSFVAGAGVAGLAAIGAAGSLGRLFEH